MRPRTSNVSPVLLLFLVSYAAVDLVPCDKSRRVFTDTWGVITDGPSGSNYTQDSHCEWLIKASGKQKYITLTFSTMGTECSYDYVFVYDGDSFRSPLLGSFSGDTEPQRVISTSGRMLILLYSDTNYVLDGFRAEFSVTECPNNCSAHGRCFRNNCTCDIDWGGFDCSRKLCPDDCGMKDNRGYCDRSSCVCHEGFSGQSCSLSVRDVIGSKWHWLSHSEGGLTPRAAHSAVYIQSTDSLYVFGGYNLNEILANLEIYHFTNSSWTDENGNVLSDKNLISIVDPTTVAELIRGAGPDWEHKWGLNSRVSFLRNLLYTMSGNVTTNRRKQRHSQSPQSTEKPLPRYGHSACAVHGGFVIFGGKLDNGSLSNDLWYYSIERRHWELRAERSLTVVPPKLTRHTLTAVDDFVYLFGGSTESGEFSSKLFRIRLKTDKQEQWEEVKVRGGKELDVRIVAHTTVYHVAANSLLVYGGIVVSVARFSKLSDRMFAFQLEERQWTEIHYTREHLREKYVPRERAFHTANIIGNYLVVFGGYSHLHNKEEICYDNQMYLYHLGCHVWVNPEILGTSDYPKVQGVFAHAADVRMGNTLLIVGGYHGNVNADLLAYTVPPMVAGRDPESSCGRHHNYTSCSADPECGWCSADDTCYGRTAGGANCTTNLQTTRCPGVCPALGDCRSCLIHGRPTSRALKSAATKLGLGECAWCVQNARCHHRDDNYGVCGLREDSPNQAPGWWGSTGTEVTAVDRCRELDKRPGLTFVKYHHPVNLTQPDHVTVVNATIVDFNIPSVSSLRLNSSWGSGQMVARLLGFLRPPSDWRDDLNVCVSYCNATLRLADTIVENVSALHTNCSSLKWPDNIPSSSRILMDFESRKVINVLGPYGGRQDAEHSKMELQHFGEDRDDPPKVFTFEYLEPFANGTCTQYTNCLHCLTDSQCGWCDSTLSCVSRSLEENVSCPTEDGDWRYLTLQPSSCSNCSNFISCESCVSSSICEWWIEEARCSRIGQMPDSAVRVEQCPVPCYQRKECGSCLEEKGRCVWCEATRQCFSFSVYTSEYQFGTCREWLDQTYPLIATVSDSNTMYPKRQQDQCKNCASHSNCSSCLRALSCGWCYDPSNPMKGACVQGDFGQSHVDCRTAVGAPDARWAYDHCPDVDECGLGLHDCHPRAVCTNTDGSFSCQCRKGYVGDGRVSCVQTCYDVCHHGRCLGEPEYRCECDLGWYGSDCSKNCGCNNHSRCPQGEGVCEKCEDWTTGEHCQYCLPGSYGNATTEQGCHRCDCNGHGEVELGECDSATGVCWCRDNTVGERCERCSPDHYYGDPRNGGLCYYRCESRGVLEDTLGRGIGSKQAYMAQRHGPPPTGECLWIINPKREDHEDDSHHLSTSSSSHQSPASSVIIQLRINASDLINVTCGDNAVYVYDGSPDLVDMGSQSTLSAVLCSEEALPTTIVESRTGLLTVHYKQGRKKGEGFSAIYEVISCDRCSSPRRCINKRCVCEEGMVGFACDEQICPDECGADLGRGICDLAYGRCLCRNGWGGKACDIKLNGRQLVFTELFNTVRLAEHLEHLRKTLPRFGHSLASDRRGSLWMFGGYSLSHGPLNDIRLFDTRNGTWMQVTVDSTPDARMPQGRYFHGADIVHSRQAIYIYGGLTKGKNSSNRTLNDFWQFDIQNQRWGEIEKEFDKLWPPFVSGHTITSFRNSSSENLIMVGGVSPENGFLSDVWEYRLDKEGWRMWETKGHGPSGLYGHTTVFHMQTNSLYVFGGYGYSGKEASLSNTLYMLNYETRTWTELNSLGYANVGMPRERFLHSAVTSDSHMFILGGRMYPWLANETFYAYSYNCNRWINLMAEGIERVGVAPGQTFAQAMTIEPDGEAAYVVGGWGGDSQCSVYRIELPVDLCSLSPSKLNCLHIPGCAYCGRQEDDSFVSEEACHNNTDKCPIADVGYGKFISNSGKICNEPLVSGDCKQFHNCTTCVQASGCGWCEDKCTTNETCEVVSLFKCPYNRCTATDCVRCLQVPGCDWSRAKQRCVDSASGDQESNDIKTCPPPCSIHSTCSDCLANKGSDECRWSTQLEECISSAYQPLYCVGGICGLILLSEERDLCPAPCGSFTQCSTCLTHAHCGWCAAPGVSGEGICTEGSADRPMMETCEMSNRSYSWHYVKCPPENECENNHHNCKDLSEVCVDREEGFQCMCGPGYNTSSQGCEPVCQQGCVRGRCVRPNICECDFGYVGANCSIQCVCNGHSDCEGPDKLDKCLKCYNNTMGERCEKCLPFFVGDPTNGGECVSCLEYCHGHTNVCVDNMTVVPDIAPDIDLKKFYHFLTEGPKENARCIRCANLTVGDRCEKCISGNFRGSEKFEDPCKPCNCHGHGDTCDPVTGDNCNCKNNTESDVCGGLSSNKNSVTPCYMVQCSKCKEGYLGVPKDGHQCYKQLTVDSKMCFDAKPIDECKIKPKPLYPGEMVFFAIQPRFMNVDIRIVIDVTQGEVDVHMSTHEDTYLAYPNSSLLLDDKYREHESTEDTVVVRNASGLRTYITVRRPKTILSVHGLKDRLVITLPEHYHILQSTRFYLVLQSVEKVAYGIVFSRQDQLHIDLFVFFSVFFSCFFLFLAACVVAWKAKQAADVRRARRRHVVEMLHMAKRPFASVTLHLGPRTKPKKLAHYDLRPVAVEPTNDGLAAVATVFVSLPGGQSPTVRLALASSLILLARQFPSSGRTFLRRRSAHAVPPT